MSDEKQDKPIINMEEKLEQIKKTNKKLAKILIILVAIILIEFIVIIKPINKKECSRK